MLGYTLRAEHAGPNQEPDMLRSARSIITILALAVVVVLLSLGPPGCATGGQPEDPQAARIRQVVAMAGIVALDLDDVRRDGATPEEVERLKADVQKAVTLVGADSNAGGALASLLAEVAQTGRVRDDAWRVGVRLLLQWAGQEPAPGS